MVGWVGERAAGAAGDGAGRDLLLNGHIDVVPAGDEAAWTTPPWDPVVRDGRVYGRGAVDMKGGLCCALFAAKAIRDAGLRLRGRLSVASVVGEEDGGTGTLADILRGHTAHGAVVAEPTRLERGPGAGRLADVPPRRARPVRARLRARGGRERRREVRAAARGAAPPGGRALRGRADGAPPSPATLARRSSPATACRGRSRSARCAPATGRAVCPTPSSPRDATASPSARTWTRPGGCSKMRSPAPPRSTPGSPTIRRRSSGGAGASTRR